MSKRRPYGYTHSIKVQHVTYYYNVDFSTNSVYRWLEGSYWYKSEVWKISDFIVSNICPIIINKSMQE